MICFDFECSSCGREYEVIFMSRKDFTPEIDCQACGGKSSQKWKSFGAKGRVGGEKGRYPRYEIQAGRTFQSASEEKAYLKERGLIQMGPDEYRRSQNVAAEPDDVINAPALREAMKEAYEETFVHGKVYPHKIIDAKKIDWVG